MGRGWRDPMADAGAVPFSTLSQVRAERSALLPGCVGDAGEASWLCPRSFADSFAKSGEARGGRPFQLYSIGKPPAHTDNCPRLARVNDHFGKQSLQQPGEGLQGKFGYVACRRASCVLPRAPALASTSGAS